MLLTSAVSPCTQPTQHAPSRRAELPRQSASSKCRYDERLVGCLFVLSKSLRKVALNCVSLRFKDFIQSSIRLTMNSYVWVGLLLVLFIIIGSMFVHQSSIHPTLGSAQSTPPLITSEGIKTNLDICATLANRQPVVKIHLNQKFLGRDRGLSWFMYIHPPHEDKYVSASAVVTSREGTELFEMHLRRRMYQDLPNESSDRAKLLFVDVGANIGIFPMKFSYEFQL